MIVLIPILACIVFLLAYEGYAVIAGKKLVTTYVREAFAEVPGVFVLGAFIAGFVCGHFFWA